MSNHRAASRYAKSILGLALEQKQLEEVHADFQKLTEVANSNYEFGVILKNPVISSEKKLAILKAIFEEGAQKLTMTFFEIISRKKREGILLDVAQEFKIQYNLHSSIQVANLTTTFPIDEKLRKEFITVVKEISGLKEVQLIETVDADIIGGFILRVNDKLLDDSISSKLRELRNQFSTNQYEKQF
ncbi:ATP synthase F1 subunit delta [Algoriphagus sediminis]|uniref:ATP synthase subunit delta n=1 Tax=Algoriphagus sediminis TaxID=3057113 RepID=A0ABT7YEL9_9BACT|nr:ATP synthase F1 subunit delta [Algoriphagus sediminis]MDN3204911.1 ATP synthase F1 subunit delta [Algoriphagus sediminis]